MNSAWSSKLSDDHSTGSVMREHIVQPVLKEGYRQGLYQGPVTIHILPDDILLEIFHFYKDDPSSFVHFTWRWNTLTQVCRRWRHVVFGSPRRLDLRLVCTSKTPTGRSLNIWPPFPIILLVEPSYPSVTKNGVENIIAALKCRDRISKVDIYQIDGPVFNELVTVLHEPLPVLAHFSLSSYDSSVPALPETFLGGSAPRLQSFGLKGIPFPSFPKFIFRFSHIVHLHLDDIPNAGYISPEVMVTCLAALPDLKNVSIGFRSPPSHLLQLSPPRLARATLPSLTYLQFSGVSEYFEDFVAQIDTPCLTWLNITFFMDLIFDIPRLRNFIDHTEGLKPFNLAMVEFSHRTIMISLRFRTMLMLEIRCERLDWQLSSMTQIFGEQLPLLSHVEQLVISEGLSMIPAWRDDPDMDPSLWLELFRLFVAVRSLHVSERLVYPVTRALQGLTEQMATEVLPVLRTLFLEELVPSGPVHEAMKPFATARQLAHQPVVIQRWER